MVATEHYNLNIQHDSYGKWTIHCLAAISLIETTLFAGIPYGWGTLLYVFKDEGIYADLCFGDSHNGSSYNTNSDSNINRTTSACADQDRRLNQWFSIAIGVGSVSNVIIGYMNQRLGTTKTRLIFKPVLVGGALFLAFTSKDLPWMILPGLTFLFVGGISLLITNMRVGSFLKVGSSVYLGLLCGSFDSSSIMTLLVKALYENGINRKYSFIGLSILHIVISGIATIIHSQVHLPRKDVRLEIESVISNKSNVQEDGNVGKDSSEKDIQSENKDNVLERKKIPTGVKLSIMGHILSSLYFLHVIFMSILVLKFVFFLGSVNKQLEMVLKDKKNVEHFIVVMSYTLMGGIIGSLLSGSILEWQKNYFNDSKSSNRYRKLIPQVVPLLICGILAVMLSALSLVSSSDVFYALFVNLVLLRSFIFAVNMGYIANVFPTEYTSVLFGLIITIFGIVSFLQYVLFIWMDAYNNALNHVNWLLLGLGILSLLHPFNVFFKAKRGHS